MDVDEQWKHVTDRDDYKEYVAMTNDYIVYIDDGRDVTWETTPAYDREAPHMPNYDQAALNSITNQVEVMSATPSEGFTSETIRRFKKLLGGAVACALDVDYASGRQMLADAQTYIRARSEETSRFWYLVACLAITLPFALAGGGLWLARAGAMAALGPVGFWITLGAAAGAIGALLSVIWRSGKLQFELDRRKAPPLPRRRLAHHRRGDLRFSGEPRGQERIDRGHADRAPRSREHHPARGRGGGRLGRAPRHLDHFDVRGDPVEDR